MNRHPIPSLLLLLLLTQPAVGWGLERYYLMGALDSRYPIQMDLGRTPSGTEWEGHYLLEAGAGERVPVGGAYVNDQTITLETRQGGAQGSPVGRFSGAFSADRLLLAGKRTTRAEADGATPFSLHRIARYRERTLTQQRPFPDEECPCAMAPATGAEAAAASCLCDSRETLIYPRFDGPRGDDLDALLGGHPTLVAGDEASGATDVQTTAEIWFYSPALISLRVDRFLFYPFNADAEETVRSLNLQSGDQGPIRELKLDDLIRPTPECRTRINNAILDDLRAKKAPAVMDPEFWGAEFSTLHESPVLIGPTGLTFLLEPYDVGPYATGSYNAEAPYAVIADCIPAQSPIAGLAGIH